MNIVNEMVSNLDERKRVNSTQPKPDKSANRGTVSWQASSTIILLIGVASLGYAIWYYNSNPLQQPMVQVAKFDKPDLSQPTLEKLSEEQQTPKAEKAIVQHKKPVETTKPSAAKEEQLVMNTTQPQKIVASKQATASVDKTKPGKKPVTANEKTVKPKSIAAKADTAKKTASKTVVTKNETPKKQVASKSNTQATPPKAVTTKAEKTTVAKVKTNKPQNVTQKAKPKKPGPKPVNVAKADKKQDKTVKKPDPAAKKLAELEKTRLKKQSIKFSNAQEAKKDYADALAKLNAGETNKAIKLLEKTLSLRSKHIAARKTLAGVYINQKKLDKAENILKQGVKEVPNASVFYHWLARIHMEREDFEKASGLLLSGSKHAKDGDYFALMALAQQNTPEFKDAIASYKQALSFKPTESKWWLGLGIVLEKSDNWQEAKDAYITALKSENLPFFLHTQTNDRLSFVNNQIALTQDN